MVVQITHEDILEKRKRQEIEGEESEEHLDRRLALEDRLHGLPVRDERLSELDSLIDTLQGLERSEMLSGYPKWKDDAARVTHTHTHTHTYMKTPEHA
jgi:hypothetical protein